MAGLTADLPVEVPLTDAEHRPIGEASLSTDERGDLVMDATLSDLSDDELPGMWSRSDFTGGIEEVRGPAGTPIEIRTGDGQAIAWRYSVGGAIHGDWAADRAELDEAYGPGQPPGGERGEPEPDRGEPPLASPGSDSQADQTSEIALEAVEVRRGSWLDRVMNRSHTDRFLQALVAQGWTLVPWLAPDESAYGWFAYPPGVEPGGRPYVLLPDTIEPGRAAANLVAALQRAGSFRWEGR